MSSVHSMSALVTGQFGIIFWTIYLMKSCVFGLPIIFCRDQTCTASKYSLMVYLVLLLSTVLINVCADSFLTSEKNNPLLQGQNDQAVPSALNTRNPSSRVLSYITLCFFHISQRQYIGDAFRIEPHCTVSFQVTFLGNNCLAHIAVQVQNSFCIMNIGKHLWIREHVYGGLTVKQYPCLGELLPCHVWSTLRCVIGKQICSRHQSFLPLSH